MVVLGVAALALCLGIVALQPEAVAMHVTVLKARLEGSEVVWPRASSTRSGMSSPEGDMDARSFLELVADAYGIPILVHAPDRACLGKRITWSKDGCTTTHLSILRKNGMDLRRIRQGLWSLDTSTLYGNDSGFIWWVGE